MLTPLRKSHLGRLLTVVIVAQAAVAMAADYPIQPVPFTAVRITDGFWRSRQETNRVVTAPYAFKQCEETKRVENFDLAAETIRRRAAGETNFQNKPLTIYPFDDSDVYKAIEGASFCLQLAKDPELEKRLDGYIARIAAAQEPDGYLYTFRTMHPDSPAHDWVDQKRWMKDPDLSHELYNIGHLYEAGFAHSQATGKSNLFDICLKSANLVYRDFGVNKLRIAPGHQVIEMGLAKLYRATGDKRFIDLAKYFLDIRGPGGPDYNQQHQRVVDQTEARGHAVRGNYMYSGMADVAALTGDQSYIDAITRIWEDAVTRKMHLTGGVGLAAGEAYGRAYDLPNNCYNETCAAIAFIMWNQRMFLMTGDGKYMDVCERSLYNGFPSGVSLSGDRFFYPNTLDYDGQAKNNHGYAGRAPWFGCACCPPNVLRTMASVGGYFYAVKGSQLYVSLYGTGTAETRVEDNSVKITQQTDYPWNGKVQFTVTPAKSAEFTLALRIPGWVEGRPVPSDLYSYEDSKPASWTISVDGKKLVVPVEKGFATIRRTWKAGDQVTLDLPMPIRRVVANAKLKADTGRVALERGPVVYCLEGVDNESVIAESVLPSSATITADYKPKLLGGVTVLKISGGQLAYMNNDGKVAGKSMNYLAIPYCTWNNRGNSPMQVWVAKDTDHARVKPAPTLASQAKATVSFTRGGDINPAYINDQLVNLNNTDRFAPNLTFGHIKAPMNGSVGVQTTCKG